jgi:hypothetical protein
VFGARTFVATTERDLMKLTDLRLALFLGALLLPASVASAQTLTPGSGWQNFQWFNCSVPCATTETWTLDLGAVTGRTELRVVDAYAGGDMFQVTVSPYPPPGPAGQQIVAVAPGVPLQIVANSSWVPLSTDPEYIYTGYYSPVLVQDDPDMAWSIPKYFSRFSVVLPPGFKYTITITVIQLAHDPATWGVIASGSAYLRATCVGAAGTSCPADTTSPLSMGVVSPFSTRAVGASLKSTGPPWTINGYPAGKGQ